MTNDRAGPERKNAFAKAHAQTILPGEHGPYIVATAAGYKSSITIGQDAWKEEDWPEDAVALRGADLLVDVIWKRGNARALTARFWREGDEELIRK